MFVVICCLIGILAVLNGLCWWYCVSEKFPPLGVALVVMTTALLVMNIKVLTLLP